MSKWCGDENCLQCADKEPDPCVHLPREDYNALRDERDRLAELVRQAQPHVCSLLCPSVKARHELWTHTKLCLNMQAALTPAGGQDAK